MTIKDIADKEKQKAENKFIEGSKNDDKDVKLISLRLQNEYIRMIDKIIEDDPSTSRNGWIVRNLIKILKET